MKKKPHSADIPPNITTYPNNMKNFGDRLYEAIKNKCPICVGIDPRIGSIPQFIKDSALEELGDTKEAVAMAFTDFSIGLIDSIHDIVPVIKPQLAFFEMYGSAGLQAFEEICEYAQGKGLIVIADGKRNDIGSTAEGYAKAFLGESELIKGSLACNFVDALTVNPYLGSDSIKPFQDITSDNGKGIFILVKTSNPSSSEIQDLACGDHMVHEEVSHLVAGWGLSNLGETHYSNIGAVVGATYPEEAKYLRSLMPNQFFLVPGYGAQGGGASSVKPCFNSDGTGALINSSRDINFAYLKNKKYSEKNYAEAAREATLAMKKDLESIF